MAEIGNSGSAPAHTGDAESGECSFCAAPNPRANIACSFCGSRLPWTFEVSGRLNFERRIYLPRPPKSETSQQPQEKSTLKPAANPISEPAPLPPGLIDTTVIKPTINPSLTEEVL